MAGNAKVSVRPAAEIDAAKHLLRAQAVAVDGATVAEMAHGCKVFQIEQDGAPVGAIAARLVDTAAGRVLEVTAAAASTERGGLDAIVKWASETAKEQGANRLSCTTARAGMVRQLKRRGFKVAGYIMTRTA